MPGVDGIQTASEIRKFDNNIKIIFLTSSAEFAVQSYEVKAYYYQLKPIEKGSFYHLLDSMLEQMEKSMAVVLYCAVRRELPGLR